MLKTYHSQQKPRRWFKNDIIPPRSCLDNPLDYVLSLTKTEQRLYNALVYHINKYELCYPSQSTIGEWIGIGRQQTNVLIGKLVSLGLLIKQKCYDDTSLYRLPSFFHKTEVCRILKPFLTAFAFVHNQTLNVASLMAQIPHKIKNTTAILMPLKRGIYIPSPCPPAIVNKKELSLGDSAKRSNIDYGRQERNSMSDKVHMMKGTSVVYVYEESVSEMEGTGYRRTFPLLTTSFIPNSKNSDKPSIIKVDMEKDSRFTQVPEDQVVLYESVGYRRC